MSRISSRGFIIIIIIWFTDKQLKILHDVHYVTVNDAQKNERPRKKSEMVRLADLFRSVRITKERVGSLI